jgi:hypothetical protein
LYRVIGAAILAAAGGLFTQHARLLSLVLLLASFSTSSNACYPSTVSLSCAQPPAFPVSTRQASVRKAVGAGDIVFVEYRVFFKESFARDCGGKKDEQI